jgi:hypothetical protein
MDSYYLNQDNISSQLKTRTFTHKFIPFSDTLTYLDSCKWYPSVNNKQKCPSTHGWNDETNTYDPCDFEIGSYFHFTFDDSLFVTIDEIPNTSFPDNINPQGFRIYHNYGDQKTILFDNYIDPADVQYPIVFCIPKCDLLYLMAIGRDSINIGIDFYDAEGRVLNNPGCDSLNIKIAFPLSLCDMFTISTVKIDSTAPCCTYRITLDMSECASNNSILKIISDSLQFKSFDQSTATPVSEMNNFIINYANGRITFNYQVCNASYNTASVFQFYFGNRAFVCQTDSIDFSSCSCSCPTTAQMESWFELSVTPGTAQSFCGEDRCIVTGKVNIPSIYNCYTKYRINYQRTFKLNIPEDGILTIYNGNGLDCLDKGEYMLDTLYLYRSFDDPYPCIIIKPAFCPFEQSPQPCTPDCDSVPWIKRTLDFELPGCAGCKVKADYQYRTNTCFNPSKQDIQITYFAAYNSGSDTTACQVCNLSVDEIHNLVLKKAIYNNAMGFNPQPPNYGCDETWRVIQASCWIDYYDNLFQPVGTIGHRPCDSTECCSIGLRVCRFEGNPEYITIDTLGGPAGVDSCANFTQDVIDWASFGNPIVHPDGSVSYYHFTTHQCQNKCNWLYGLSDPGYYGKKAIQYDIESKLNYGTNEINIRIKIDNDHLDFYIESDINCDNLKIAIFSLQGQNLVSNKFNLQRGENYYQIPINRLTTGMYFVNVIIDGLILKTEKFIIIK